MEILLNECIKKFFKREYYFKNSDNIVLYTAKTNLLNINKKIDILNSNGEKVARIKKRMFNASLPKYDIDILNNEKFYLEKKVNLSYKFHDKPWYITGDIRELFNTIITLNNTLVAEINEQLGWQPNFKINIIDESQIVQIICVVICIYYSKRKIVGK